MNKDQAVRLRVIYLSSRQYMKDTLEDWKKVFSCFEKVLTESGNDKQVNQEIQRLVVKLENYLRRE